MKLSWAKEICYQYGNKFVNKILRCLLNHIYPEALF